MPNSASVGYVSKFDCILKVQISVCSLILIAVLGFQANSLSADEARAAELKAANVELARNTTVLFSDSDDNISTIAETLYRMVFKRDAKAKDEGKKDESASTKKAEEGKNFTSFKMGLAS